MCLARLQLVSTVSGTKPWAARCPIEHCRHIGLTHNVLTAGPPTGCQSRAVVWASQARPAGCCSHGSRRCKLHRQLQTDPQADVAADGAGKTAAAYVETTLAQLLAPRPTKGAHDADHAAVHELQQQLSKQQQQLLQEAEAAGNAAVHLHERQMRLMRLMRLEAGIDEQDQQQMSGMRNGALEAVEDLLKQELPALRKGLSGENDPSQVASVLAAVMRVRHRLMQKSVCLSPGASRQGWLPALGLYPDC